VLHIYFLTTSVIQVTHALGLDIFVDLCVHRHQTSLIRFGRIKRSVLRGSKIGGPQAFDGLFITILGAGIVALKLAMRLAQLVHALACGALMRCGVLALQAPLDAACTIAHDLLLSPLVVGVVALLSILIQALLHGG